VCRGGDDAGRAARNSTVGSLLQRARRWPARAGPSVPQRAGKVGFVAGELRLGHDARAPRGLLRLLYRLPCLLPLEDDLLCPTTGQAQSHRPGRTRTPHSRRAVSFHWPPASTWRRSTQSGQRARCTSSCDPCRGPDHLVRVPFGDRGLPGGDVSHALAGNAPRGGVSGVTVDRPSTQSGALPGQGASSASRRPGDRRLPVTRGTEGGSR
jgi:hypothetical protein